MIRADIQAYLLFSGQTIAHIGFIWAIFNYHLVNWPVVLFIYFLGACLGGTVTYHRLLSHKSWNAPGWWYYVGSLLGFWVLVGSPLAWSNNHIAHHKYVDTKRDPHSPKFIPWWKVQWFSMFHSHPRLTFSLRNMNKFQLFLHKYYFHIHLLIFLVLLSFGIEILVTYYLAPAALVWTVASLINTINHSNFLGYRNYDTSDYSTNNILTGILVFGEGWHNNHHRYPGNAKFGKNWYEIDIGYVFIKIIEKLRFNETGTDQKL